MKKINIILGIATMAFLASCGSKTESSATDSTATSTEAPAPEATETPAPEAPAEAAPAEGGTTVEANKDGAAVSTDKANVEVGKGGIKAEVKK